MASPIFLSQTRLRSVPALLFLAVAGHAGFRFSGSVALPS